VTPFFLKVLLSFSPDAGKNHIIVFTVYLQKKSKKSTLNAKPSVQLLTAGSVKEENDDLKT